MLQSSSAVIQALGGTTKVADLLEVGSSAISNYRKNGFPPRVCVALAKICAAQNIQVASHVFGLPNIEDTAWRRQAALSGGQAHLELFNAAGFELIETPVLQPADPFIELMGEEMRRRLFTFTDPVGETLCLRPDLTIPTARQYIQQGDFERRQYYYSGTAFRYQPRGAGKPEEFYQAGVEIIGGDDAIADEGEILKLIVQAIEAAQVTRYQIVLNNLGMFTHFLAALGLSEGAQKRLERAYHQSANFDAVLQTMLSETQNPKPARDMALINGDDDFDIAGRSIGEINARITRLQSEAEGGLDERQARAIQNFLQLAGPAASVLESIASLLDNASALEGFTDYWQRLFAAAGLPMDGDSTGREIILAPAEGRKMAYYTGLAFEIHVPALGTQRVIASGGRYDDLLQSLGAAQIIPAIGGAIALERLQTAAQQQGGA